MHISFRRTSNKEATGYSYMTGLVIQGFRALGKDHVNEAVISALNRQISSEDKKTMLVEAKGTTAWIYDFIKEVCMTSI